MKFLAATLAALALLGAGVAIGNGEPPGAVPRLLIAQNLGTLMSAPGDESRVEVSACHRIHGGDRRCRFRVHGSRSRCEGVIQVRELTRKYAGWARRLRCR